jgi:hypothetical protein
MTANFPNAFVQTDIEKKEIGQRIVVKICKPLVNMLVELSPETFEASVV